MKLVINKKTLIKSVIKDEEFDSNLYEDMSHRIENWYDYGLHLSDYVIVRDEIKKLVTIKGGINNLKPTAKKYVSILCADTPESIIGYYMAQGMSQQEAISFYKERRGTDIRRASEVYTIRITSDAYTIALITYLSEDDSQAYLDATRNFNSDFQNAAIKGTNYGNSVNGIMDYIESTGDYVNGGLKNYTIESPYTLEEFVNKLKNILIYGNY